MKNNSMGEKIKKIRLDLGKSQFEFGQLFNPPAPKSAVSRWEHGGSPNKKRLKRIAELGNVPVDFLTNGDLISAIDNLYNFLYAEYENYIDYMTVESHDVRSYIVDNAENNTSSRMKYQSIAEFFSYINLLMIGNNDLKNLFNLCAGKVYQEAKVEHIKANDEGMLLNLFVDVAKRQAFNLERDNNGLLNMLSEGIDELAEKIHRLYFGIDQNKLGNIYSSRKLSSEEQDVELPNTIDKKLFDNAESLLKETKKEIKKLKGEYED